MYLDGRISMRLEWGTHRRAISVQEQQSVRTGEYKVQRAQDGQ